MADQPNVLDYTVGDFNYRRTVVTSSLTVATPRVVYGSTHSVTVTLASSMHSDGVWVGVKDESGAAGNVGNAITIDGDGTTIDGSTSFMVNSDFESAIVYSDGSNWFSIGRVGGAL